MEFFKKLAARAGDANGNPAVVMACMGDSVTHGCFEVFTNRFGQIDTRYAPQDGYVSKLQARLNRYCPAGAVSAINCGISGDSAAGGLARIQRDALAHAPDLVTLMFGLNDAMNADTEKGLAAYEGALSGMVEKVLSCGAECVVMTPNRMCAYVDGQLPEGLLRDVAKDAARVQNEGILDRYMDAARRVAREAGVPLADAYAAWQAMERAGVDTTALLVNHINHPAAFAHELFVEALWNCLL